MWHGYFGIENLALTTGQRDQLVAALRQLGPGSDPSPARLCHWRTRTDGQAAIFEAAFDETMITVQAFKNRLGTIFNVDPATIGSVISHQLFSALNTAVIVFARGGTNRLRVTLFGVTVDESTGEVTYWPTWDESRVEARAYLVANAAAWE